MPQTGGVNFGGTDKEVQRALEKVSKQYPEATWASLYQEGFAMAASAKKRTPVRTGRLRASAYVSPPTGDRVEVGYGTDYALEVHEKTEANFKVGEAKFLENAFNERMDGFVARLGKRIVENVERGMGLKDIKRPSDIGDSPEG